MAGDGRHDSMGHSAKFCAYTMFCCTMTKIIHFDLVQVLLDFDHTLGNTELYSINYSHLNIGIIITF